MGEDFDRAFVHLRGNVCHTGNFKCSTSYIKKRKKKQVKLILIIHFIWLNISKICLSIGSVLKNSPANAGDTRDSGSNSELGRSPGEGNDNPFQYSCLENSMDRGAWWAAVHGVAKSWTHLSMQHTRARLQPTPTPAQVECSPRPRPWSPRLGFTSSLCHSLTWVTILLLRTSVCPSVKWEWCPCFRVAGGVSESVWSWVRPVFKCGW